MSAGQGGVALPAAAAVVRICVEVCSIQHSGDCIRMIRAHQLQCLTHVATFLKHRHHLHTVGAFSFLMARGGVKFAFYIQYDEAW